MTVYLIGEVTVTQPDWISGYAINVHDIVHKHGGKYLSRSGNITQLEGEPSGADMVAIVEFPNKEALDAFWNDEEYRAFRQSRQQGSNSNVYVVDDADAAGTIPYLSKSTDPQDT